MFNSFDRELFMRVVAMSEDRAKAFAMPNAAKVVCHGPACTARYKRGANEYFLFATMNDYYKWLEQESYD